MRVSRFLDSEQKPFFLQRHFIHICPSLSSLDTFSQEGRGPGVLVQILKDI